MRYVASLLALASLASAADPKVELGRRLFMDPTVSRSGKLSCSSCHDPEHGFSDPRPLSEDESGKTRRHSQPLLDLARGDVFHWDGEFGSVRDLLTARLGSPAEAVAVARKGRVRAFEAARSDGRQPDVVEFQSLICRLTVPYSRPATSAAGPAPVVERLEVRKLYSEGFRKAFGSGEITIERIIEALLRYVHSLGSGENAYDRFCGGDANALTACQKRGLALFTGKASCAACHSVDPGDDGRSLLTDGAFHNTGIAFRTRDGVIQGRSPDGGVGEINFVAADLGKFKTPSLRDVARRPPYMHDGSLATLDDVVRYYDRGGTRNWHLDDRIYRLDLTDGEVGDLVGFLESLTSDERPGLGPARRQPRWLRIRVVDLRGKPLQGFPVRVRPAGDRLQGGRLADPPQRLDTDAWGYVAFRFPAWTHVGLESPGYDYDRLIPDCVTRTEVIAAPRDTIALEVRVPDGERLPREDELLAVAKDSKQVTGFRFVRRIDGKRALYVADRPWSLPWRSPGRVAVSFGFSTVDLDLAGGWTDPVDLTGG